MSDHICFPPGGEMLPAALAINDQTQIQIYPNPAHTILFISLPPDSIDITNAKIRMLDVTGKLIKEMHTFGSLNSMNVNNLASGTYIIEISDSRKQFIRKVIKN